VPSADEWGKLLWAVIHGLAEYSGRQTNSLLRADELRGWDSFFKVLEKGIPCETCRDHYKQWYIANKPVLPTDYSQVREYVREWFWRLHEDINQRLGKPSFPLADLTGKYGRENVSYTLKQLQALIKASVMGGTVSLFSWNALVKAVFSLKSIYGI
jgi:hypothetical protein